MQVFLASFLFSLFFFSFVAPHKSRQSNEQQMQNAMRWTKGRSSKIAVAHLAFFIHSFFCCLFLRFAPWQDVVCWPFFFSLFYCASLALSKGASTILLLSLMNRILELPGHASVSKTVAFREHCCLHIRSAKKQ